MRHARLFVSSLVVLLLFQFRFEAFSPRAGRQVGRIQPSVHRAVYLFHGNASRLFARRLVVFLTNAGTEQMTELRHVEVTVHATPATNFVVVQAEFFLPFAKAAFDRPAAKGYSQQPTQRDAFARDRISIARRPVGQKVFHFASQYVSSDNQAMPSRRKTCLVLAPKNGPLDIPHLGAVLRVLDSIPLPRLLAENRRVSQ